MYRGYGQVIQRGESPLVTGTPAQTARLRPLRNPLYDTAKMVAGAGYTFIEFFTNRRAFADGTAKSEADTNMTADGQLGSPLEMDMLGLTGKLLGGTSLVNINAFYNAGVVKWFFHQNVPWLTLKVTEFPSGIAPVGYTTEATSTIYAQGVQELNNFWNMTDHLRQARHILPQESFKGRVEFPGTYTPAADDVYYVMVMLGMLYAAL